MSDTQKELEAAWEKILRLDQQVQALKAKNQKLLQDLFDYKALVASQLTRLKVALG